MTAPMIQVDGLSKRYRLGASTSRHLRLGEALGHWALEPARRWLRRKSTTADASFWALEDVDFKVGRGDVVGVIGKNGAGKSTLLKILSRITEPTKGRAVLRGRVASLLEVGTGFHGELTGRENVYLNGAFLGMRKREIDRKFDAIVEFSEVEAFIDTPVKRYSSGMYVRLAFAVAAHLEPEILLVDEVLAVGDAEFQRKCLGKMNDIADEGRTVLFVSHNMSAVQRLCASAILLRKGRIATAGETNSVVSEYLRSSDGGSTSFQADSLTGRQQLLSVRLFDSRGAPLEKALSTEPFTFELAYLLPDRSPGVRVGIGLLSHDGIVIFTSNCLDTAVSAPSRAGRYTARVTVPGDVLLPGDYHLAVCIYDDSAVLDLHEPAVSLTVEPGPSNLYLSAVRRKGFVQVPCRWEIEPDTRVSGEEATGRSAARTT